MGSPRRRIQLQHCRRLRFTVDWEECVIFLSLRIHRLWACGVFCCILTYTRGCIGTLLNRLFGTTFDVMDETNRQQTTKGKFVL